MGRSMWRWVAQLACHRIGNRCERIGPVEAASAIAHSHEHELISGRDIDALAKMPAGVEIGRRTPQCFPALPLEGENSVVPDVRRLRIASRGRGCGHPRRCQNPSHSPPAAIQVESAKLGQVDGPGGESAFGLFESALLPVHIPQGVVLRPDRLPHPFCQIARECSRRRAPLTSPFQTPRADAQLPCDQRETCCCGGAGVRRIF